MSLTVNAPLAAEVWTEHWWDEQGEEFVLQYPFGTGVGTGRAYALVLGPVNAAGVRRSWKISGWDELIEFKEKMECLERFGMEAAL